MAGVDVALKDQELGAEQPAMVKTASTYVPDPNLGKPTSSWARLAQQGAAQTQKAKIITAASKVKGGIEALADWTAKTAKDTGKDITKTAVGAGKAAVGAGKEVYDTARLVAAANSKNPEATKNALTASKNNQGAFNTTRKTLGQVGNSIVKPVVKSGADVVDLIDSALSHIPGYKGSKTVEQNMQGTKIGTAVSNYLGKPDNVKQMIGNAVQTGVLVIPGGGEVEESIDLSGKFLVDKLGSEGVKELAGKAGIHVAEDDSDAMLLKMADTVAKSSVGKEAIKSLASKESGSFLVRFAKSVGEGAAGFGAYNAGSATSQNESGKQILKAGVKGAETGAFLGGASDILKGAVAKVTGKTAFADRVKQMASDHADRTAKIDADTAKAAETNRMATERGLPAGKTPKTLSGGASKALPEGEKVPASNESEITIKGEAGTPKTIPLEKGEYEQRLSDISKSYDKETKAAEKITSPLKQRVVLEDVDQKHQALLDQLDKEDKEGKANPDYKEATPDKTVKTGFTTKTPEQSATTTVVGKRISQLDSLISEAQRVGTSKSATELRSMMRERSDLKDVVAGKKTVADVRPTVKSKVTMQDLQKAANKDAGVTPVTKDDNAEKETASDKLTKTKSKGVGGDLYHGTAKGNNFGNFDINPKRVGGGNNIMHQGDAVYLDTK